MVSSTSSSKDYYKELEIDRNATTAEVRAAYRRLALVWHPDRNKAKEAEEKFKLIKKAYDVLSDQIRRREYDQERKSNLVEEQNWFEDATVNQSKRLKIFPIELFVVKFQWRISSLLEAHSTFVLLKIFFQRQSIRWTFYRTFNFFKNRISRRKC